MSHNVAADVSHGLSKRMVKLVLCILGEIEEDQLGRRRVAGIDCVIAATLAGNNFGIGERLDLIGRSIDAGIENVEDLYDRDSWSWRRLLGRPRSVDPRD